MRKQTHSEQAFTLIELLVVMIIIAILMAVAVPTFLAQKSTAQKSKATANIKQIINAIESCASNNTDAGYKGCLDATSDGDNSPLLQYEKGLQSIDFKDMQPGEQNTSSYVNYYSITPTDTATTGADNPQGYLVQTAIKDGDKNIFFAEVHRADGHVYRMCSESPFGPEVDGTYNGQRHTGPEGSRACTTGWWG